MRTPQSLPPRWAVSLFAVRVLRSFANRLHLEVGNFESVLKAAEDCSKGAKVVPSIERLVDESTNLTKGYRQAALRSVRRGGIPDSRSFAGQVVTGERLQESFGLNLPPGSVDRTPILLHFFANETENLARALKNLDNSGISPFEGVINALHTQAERENTPLSVSDELKFLRKLSTERGWTDETPIPTSAFDEIPRVVDYPMTELAILVVGWLTVLFGVVGFIGNGCRSISNVQNSHVGGAVACALYAIVVIVASLAIATGLMRL